MNQKQIKARNLRYKRSILDELNLDAILDEFWKIQEECDNARYYIDDDSGTLLNALDGDEEEEYEFRMMFADLSAQCEQLNDMLTDRYITEHYDTFVALIGGGSRYRMLGWDSYEANYYGLTEYETELAQDENGKRIKQLTKDTLISVATQCFGIIVTFFDLRYTYDYLKAAYDVLLDSNTSYLKMIKDIDAAYEAAEAAEWYQYSDEVKKFEQRCEALPDQAWVE